MVTNISHLLSVNVYDIQMAIFLFREYYQFAGIKRTFENKVHNRETLASLTTCNYAVFLWSLEFSNSLDRVKRGSVRRYVPLKRIHAADVGANRKKQEQENVHLRSPARAILVCTCKFSPQTFYGHAFCKAAMWNSNWIPYTIVNILASSSVVPDKWQFLLPTGHGCLFT